MRQILGLIWMALALQAAHADTHINPLISLGIPPTAEMKSTLDIYPQSHTIEIGHEGFIYVGGSSGVSVYNGEQWQHIPMPNGKLVRSLAKGADRTIYVGGYNLFGAISPDPTGSLRFTDLSSSVQNIREAGFADIWDLVVTRDAVYFKAVKDLFRYDLHNQNVTYWQHEARFGALSLLNNEIFVQYRGLGLARFIGGNFEIVSEHEHWHEQIYDLVALGDGSWLGNTRSGAWLHVENTRVGSADDWLMPNVIEFDNLPQGDEFYDVLSVDAGIVGMAHKNGSIYLLHWPDRRVEQLPVSQDMVVEIDVVANQALFALTDQAVVRLSWPSPWRLVNPSSGLRGRVHNIRNWRNEWYVLTGAGVFQLNTPESRHFSKLPWTNHEAWDLLPLSNNAALLANSYYLMHISDQGVQDISHGSLYPRLLMHSQYNSEQVLIGTELGLAIWQSESGLLLDWSELGSLVHSIVELSPTQLLLGTQHRGVVLVTLTADRSGVQQVQFLNQANGIEYGIEGEAILTAVENLIVASTAKGIFLWENDRFSAYPALLAEAMDPIQAVRIQPGMHNDYWAFSHNRLYYRPPSTQESVAWRRVELNGLIPGAISALYAQSSETRGVILGANSALVIYQPEFTTSNPISAQVQLNGVQRIQEGVSTRLNIDESYSFPAGRAAIRFNFSLPTAAPAEHNLYRARLEGYEESFSDWGRSTQITYSNLTPGTYRFIVKAQALNGVESETLPFEFTITPPWHAHPVLKILYALSGIVALWGFTRYLTRRRTRILAAEKKRLKTMVDERTAELATANLKLESMANVDGLTGIANRRRLDQYLSVCVEQSKMSEKSLALLLIDVDHFKAYNDSHGHLAGDTALRDVALMLQGCLRRQEDLAARYGGEEFAVVMPGAQYEHAREVAECIRQRVDETIKDITVSVGVALLSEHLLDTQSTIEQLISDADQALYKAKHGGRNQVQ